MDALVAFAAALLSLRLAGLLAGRFRSSRRPELLAWAAGLAAYAVAATRAAAATPTVKAASRAGFDVMSTGKGYDPSW